MVTTSMPSLKRKYVEEVFPALQREFNYANRMQVPGLVKVGINIGLGEALTNGRAVESATAEIGRAHV